MLAQLVKIFNLGGLQGLQLSDTGNDLTVLTVLLKDRLASKNLSLEEARALYNFSLDVSDDCADKNGECVSYQARQDALRDFLLTLAKSSGKRGPENDSFLAEIVDYLACNMDVKVGGRVVEEIFEEFVDPSEGTINNLGVLVRQEDKANFWENRCDEAHEKIAALEEKVDGLARKVKAKRRSTKPKKTPKKK